MICSVRALLRVEVRLDFHFNYLHRLNECLVTGSGVAFGASSVTTILNALVGGVVEYLLTYGSANSLTFTDYGRNSKWR